MDIFYFKKTSNIWTILSLENLHNNNKSSNKPWTLELQQLFPKDVTSILMGMWNVQQDYQGPKPGKLGLVALSMNVRKSQNK